MQRKLSSGTSLLQQRRNTTGGFSSSLSKAEIAALAAAEAEEHQKKALLQAEENKRRMKELEEQKLAVEAEVLRREEDAFAKEVTGPAFELLDDDANVDDTVDDLLPGRKDGAARLHLRGHADVVKACCFDEHHRLLFTASWDGNVLVWNLEFFESPIARLQHKEWVNAVATTYVPDLTVLTVTDDGYIFGWQCEQLLAERQLRGERSPQQPDKQEDTFSHQRRFEVVAQVQVSHGALTHLAVHADFNFAFASCGDTTFAVHLSSGSVIREYVTAAPVTALSAVDAVLCIAQQSGTITIYDIVGSFVLRELSGHRGAVRCISVVDPYTVMTAGDDCSVRTWNLASGACLSNRRRVHTKAIVAISHFYTDRDRLVVTAGMDGTVKVTRQSNGRVVATFGLLSSCMCIIPPLLVDETNVDEVVDMLTNQVCAAGGGGGSGTGAACGSGGSGYMGSSRLWEEGAAATEYTPSAVYHMRGVTGAVTTTASGGGSASAAAAAAVADRLDQLNAGHGVPLSLPGTTRVISDAHVTRSARWAFFPTIICGGHTGRVTRLSLEKAVSKKGDS